MLDVHLLFEQLTTSTADKHPSRGINSDFENEDLSKSASMTQPDDYLGYSRLSVASAVERQPGSLCIGGFLSARQHLSVAGRLSDCIEDAVDKRARFLVPETLRHFNGLVDDDPGRHLV